MPADVQSSEHLGADIIFTSPLERAATARAFSDATGAPFVVLGDLVQLHHGEFAGMTDAEIATRHPRAWKRRSTDNVLMGLPPGRATRHRPPSVERLASAATHPARRSVLVSHEMMGRMLQRHLLGLDAREVVGFRHRHDVGFAIAPRTSARMELRPAF